MDKPKAVAAAAHKLGTQLVAVASCLKPTV